MPEELIGPIVEAAAHVASLFLTPAVVDDAVDACSAPAPISMRAAERRKEERRLAGPWLLLGGLLVLGSPARSIGAVCRCGQLIVRFPEDRPANFVYLSCPECGREYSIHDGKVCESQLHVHTVVDDELVVSH
jgi:hypothetical protein